MVVVNFPSCRRCCISKAKRIINSRSVVPPHPIFASQILLFQVLALLPHDGRLAGLLGASGGLLPPARVGVGSLACWRGGVLFCSASRIEVVDAGQAERLLR